MIYIRSKTISKGKTEEWSSLSSLVSFGKEQSTFSFYSTDEKSLNEFSGIRSQTIMHSWFVSSRCTGDGILIESRFLDIELTADKNEDIEWLNRIHGQLTGETMGYGNITLLQSGRYSTNNDNCVDDWDELLAGAEVLIKNQFMFLKQLDQQVNLWEQRVELALQHGEDDLAKEAYSRKLGYANERDLLRIQIKSTEEDIEELRFKIKDRAETISENDSSQTESNGNKSVKSVEEILKEIDNLIGLDNIKHDVRSLVNSLQVNQMRRSAGLPDVNVSKHMVFYGNPGTGKTTIARMLGELFRLLGVLTKGQFIETDRSGLVGGYLGQTALKTREVLESALGGILFVDEAYSLLSSENKDQYGQEAIDTILKFMEDHRDDFVLIVAGYENLMSNFLQSNPGLKSRFNKYFNFKDYSPDQLLAIFLTFSNESNYILSEDAVSHLRDVILELDRKKREHFGNGRTIRNLFEKSIANQANRIMSQGKSRKEDLICLSREDILWEDMLEVSR